MKKNLKKINQGLKLVNQIQKIRSKNNKNWMDLLRLSLKLDFNSFQKFLKKFVKMIKEFLILHKKFIN